MPSKQYSHSATVQHSETVPKHVHKVALAQRPVHIDDIDIRTSRIPYHGSGEFAGFPVLAGIDT